MNRLASIEKYFLKGKCYLLMETLQPKKVNYYHFVRLFNVIL